MTNRRRLIAAVAILLLVLPGLSSALTCTATAGSTNFGSYDPLSAAPVDSVGTISVACTNLLSILVGYTIQLSTGLSTTYAAREMANGTNRLQYNLYTGPGRTVIWGDGTGGSATVSDGYLLLLLSRTIDYSVYGRIPAGQNVAVGAYADTIIVSVIY
jgi:spore coat protein U-like protein